MKSLPLFLSVFLSASLFGQNVYIPDAKFKAFLVGNPEINTNGDSEIQVSEANIYDGRISVSGQISDLTGIEAFTALTYLNCQFNKLRILDVSNNTALTYLNCHSNQLTQLIVGQNTSLTELYCTSNKLTSLDLSGANALNHLDCMANKLTNLDISKNRSLTKLLCSTIN